MVSKFTSGNMEAPIDCPDHNVFGKNFQRISMNASSVRMGRDGK